MQKLPQTGGRVLLVDPSAEVQAAMAEVLTRLAGMAVRGASRLPEVRQALDEWQPGVVVLELKRRDGRGLAMCREILAHPSRPRVLVITSYLDPWERLEALLAGASGYLLKEVDGQALANAVLALARDMDPWEATEV